MNPRELIRRTAETFRAAGIPDPDTDAALLLSHVLYRPPLELRLDTDTELDSAVLDAFAALAGRRAERVPVQYLLNEAPFYRRMFFVDPRVLIPRPETELLCEWALSVISGLSSPRVLDLCCGSGCIGLTIKAERPDAAVTLSDISRDALDVAASNAARHSLDVELVQADLLDGFDVASMDMILSNPPYIPTEDCASLQPEVLREPVLALDGGPDGCDLYHRIALSAGRVLRPGGKLLMELGIREFAPVASLLASEGFTDIQVRKDLNGIDRMILAARP